MSETVEVKGKQRSKPRPATQDLYAMLGEMPEDEHGHGTWTFWGFGTPSPRTTAAVAAGFVELETEASRWRGRRTTEGDKFAVKVER